jgi:alpha-glucosidase
MLLSFRGSVCLYQGEELGLPETDMLFEELTDPPGIRFWPEYKGRDGCRTPMPWEENQHMSGFTNGTPWLPVKPPQAALCVERQQADPDSTLNFYRRILAFRREHPVLIEGGIEFLKVAEPVLAFRRTSEEANMLCVFNLSAEPVRVTLEAGGETLPPLVSERAELRRGRLSLGPNGYAFFEEAAAGRIGILHNRRPRQKIAA